MYDLAEFNARVEFKLVRKTENTHLVLYNYTDLCVYERAWDDYTRISRGIIFEKATGRIVARPFEKFFNLGEMPETYLTNLPNQHYHVTVKMDGSLGIIYWYNNTWNVATKGSLASEQALKAQAMISKYDLSKADKTLTYLCEIIYPENKIVVNYGTEEKLVLLGAIHTESGKELDYKTLLEHASLFNMPAVEFCYHTIEEMIALQKELPKDQEGFVVRFRNGLRVKIKGAEYLRVHKIISCLSPLSAWEVMQNGVVNKDYLTQIPEEYQKDFQPIVDSLEASYSNILEEIKEDLKRLPTTDASTKEGAKAIGLFINSENHGMKHPRAIFPYLKNSGLEKYIMNVIRPKANVLV